jgi:hypothetical protein
VFQNRKGSLAGFFPPGERGIFKNKLTKISQCYVNPYLKCNVGTSVNKVCFINNSCLEGGISLPIPGLDLRPLNMKSEVQSGI